MRVWEIPPDFLCRKHLLGEHREIHCIYNVITQGKKGYSGHPETLRWTENLAVLIVRHNRVALEMTKRSYDHASPIEMPDSKKWELFSDIIPQRKFIYTPEEQIAILKEKGCECRIQDDEQAMLALRKIAEDPLYIFAA